MTSSIEDIVPSPIDPNLSLHTEPSFYNYAATVRAEYRNLDSETYASPLTAALKHLPTLLPALTENDRKERLKSLIRTFSLPNSRIEFQNKVRVNGHDFIQRFFRTVPLLTELEVRQRLHKVDHIELLNLMQISLAGETFYVADQCLLDGTLHPLLAACMCAFRDADFSDWDIATWWVNPTGWLSGSSPRDVYNEDPESVQQAWEQTIAHRYV